MSQNQEESSEEDRSEASQQDVATNEEGVHNLEKEISKTKLPSLQHQLCSSEIVGEWAQSLFVFVPSSDILLWISSVNGQERTFS